MDVIKGHIDINGLKTGFKKIIINEGGSRSPLVFLHEGLGSIAQWRNFPEMLCELTGRNGYLYDRPGFGESDADTEQYRPDFMEYHARKFLPAFLDEMNIKKPVLTGHSDGGTIALHFAAEFPEIPAGAITLAAHIFNEKETIAGIRKIDDKSDKNMLIEKLKKYHGRKAEMIFRRWRDIWLSDDFRSWNIEYELRNILCPVLALQGADDPYGTSAQLRLIEKNCPHAIAVLMDNAAHAPHIESADETLRICREFLKGI